MDDKEIDDVVFEIEEIICEYGNITEPAGRGCGYGISDAGEKELTAYLKNLLQ